MRVITGEFRGFALAAPHGQTTRPITDQAKESLFNILGCRFGTLAELPPLSVLDLFAGSGALGLECLSRGAAHCLFVERDRAALQALRTNIDKLRVAARAAVAAENAWTMRVPPEERSGGYGLIFVDPPYRDAENALRVVDLLERTAPRLAADGLMVFRHGDRGEFPADRLRLLRVVDQRAFGKMQIVLLERALECAAADTGGTPVPQLPVPQPPVPHPHP